MEKVKIKLKDGVSIPQYESNLAVGVDLTVNSVIKGYNGQSELGNIMERHIRQKDKSIKPFFYLYGFERALVGTGIYVELPKGIEMQIRSRSGLALKQGLVVMNQPGTIDPDYRGEVGVILYNSTEYSIKINFGDRIAQAVFNKVEIPEFEIVDELTDTDRGTGGFGSTGINTSDQI